MNKDDNNLPKWHSEFWAFNHRTKRGFSISDCHSGARSCRAASRVCQQQYPSRGDEPSTSAQNISKTWANWWGESAPPNFVLVAMVRLTDWLGWTEVHSRSRSCPTQKRLIFNTLIVPKSLERHECDPAQMNKSEGCLAFAKRVRVDSLINTWSGPLTTANWHGWLGECTEAAKPFCKSARIKSA